MEELLLTEDMKVRDPHLRFKLYMDKHWYFASTITTKKGLLKPTDRKLMPELLDWLINSGLEHEVKLGAHGFTYIWFKSRAGAMMFKLAWHQLD